MLFHGGGNGIGREEFERNGGSKAEEGFMELDFY